MLKFQGKIQEERQERLQITKIDGSADLHLIILLQHGMDMIYQKTYQQVLQMLVTKQPEYG